MGKIIIRLVDNENNKPDVYGSAATDKIFDKLRKYDALV